jgi:hypothetical protein
MGFEKIAIICDVKKGRKKEAMDVREELRF